MGAKTQANVKEKRPMITCDQCQEKFHTTRALKSHILVKHTNENKSSTDALDKEKKTACVPPTYRVSSRLKQKKSMEKDKVEEEDEDSDRKIVFLCPQCMKLYSVYFSALKHIERRHVEAKRDNIKLKPILVELCTICNNRIFENEQHICEGPVSGMKMLSKPTQLVFKSEDVTPKLLKMSKAEKLRKKSDGGIYTCLGCSSLKNFQSIDLFDQHIPTEHCEEVDILVFPDTNDFISWKTNMESQVRVKYLSLNNTSDCQYYQCNYVSTKNSATMTHLCPSVLITRKLPRGVEVQFYKKHSGHLCPEYSYPEKYLRRVIDQTSVTNDEVFDSLLNDEDVLYIKFRNLLKNIIADAARIDITHLKKLYSIALEMQTCLNSYGEDFADGGSQNKQESLHCLRVIEKENVGDNDDTEQEKEKIINSDNIYSILKIEPEETNLDDEMDTSGNKSMTDDQIAKILEGPRSSERLKRKSESSTPIIKRKKVDTDKKTKEGSEVKTGLKENNSLTKEANTPKVVKSPSAQSPSFNDTYKQFIDYSLKSSPTKLQKLSEGKTQKLNETKSPRKSVTRKEVVKTKIGQFIPSPKKLLSKDNSENVEIKVKCQELISPRRSKVDINLEALDYEVVEQENDCNILVLKI